MNPPGQPEFTVADARPNTLEKLWLQFRTDLIAFLKRRLPTEADAEDILQDLFLRIQEGAARLDAVENVEGWLFSIARRAVADFYRARGRRVDVGALDVGEEPSPPPADEQAGGYRGSHDVHEEVLSWLRPMVDELPEAYRVPVRLADVEGRTQQEVADELGLSLSGAKSRVQRGRALLGDLLQRCCAIEFGEEGRAVAFQRLRPADDPCGAGCTAPDLI